MVKLEKLCLYIALLHTYYSTIQIYLPEASENLRTLPGTPVSVVTRLAVYYEIEYSMLYSTQYDIYLEREREVTTANKKKRIMGRHNNRDVVCTIAPIQDEDMSPRSRQTTNPAFLGDTSIT